MRACVRADACVYEGTQACVQAGYMCACVCACMCIFVNDSIINKAAADVYQFLHELLCTRALWRKKVSSILSRL